MYIRQAVICGLLLGVLCVASSALSEPYAPPVRPWLKDIPEREEVGVPPYPDSRVTSVMKDGPPVPSKKCLPVVTLLTRDEPKKVAEFYKDRLSGYHYTLFNGRHIFYKGPEKSGFEVLSVVTDCTIPSVFIDRAKPEPSMPDAKSFIEIHYRRGK